MEFIIKDKKLVDIKDPEPDVHIPEGVEKLERDVFNDLKETRNVWFPKSLVDCRGPRVLLFRDQANIFVHPGNPVFSSDDGVLYNKDFSVLLCCPMKKRGSYRTLPMTKTIAEDAFCCSILDELVLNRGLESIERYAFCDSSIHKWVIIPETVKHIDKEAFAGEWNNQCIVVVEGSYAHYYVMYEDNSIWKYRCIQGY